MGWRWGATGPVRNARPGLRQSEQIARGELKVPRLRSGALRAPLRGALVGLTSSKESVVDILGNGLDEDSTGMEQTGRQAVVGSASTDHESGDHVGQPGERGGGGQCGHVLGEPGQQSADHPWQPGEWGEGGQCGHGVSRAGERGKQSGQGQGGPHEGASPGGHTAGPWGLGVVPPRGGGRKMSRMGRAWGGRAGWRGRSTQTQGRTRRERPGRRARMWRQRQRAQR